MVEKEVEKPEVEEMAEEVEADDLFAELAAVQEDD
jgi:hypothetical protein